MALRRQHAAGAFIDGEVGIHPLAMVVQQIVDAIDAVRGFFAAGECEPQRAAEAETFLPQADHQIEEHSRHRFVVASAAGIEISVLFNQRERIALPILAPRINDIVLKRRGISADTAMRLARYFGGDAQSWLNLQTIYDLRVAERTSARKIEREVAPAEQAAAA